MNNLEFYAIYARYDKIIIRLEQKVVEHKIKHLKADLSEQQKVIDDLINLRQMFHKLYHINLTLERGQIEVVIERERLLNRINQLQTENNNLKLNRNA